MLTIRGYPAGPELDARMSEGAVVTAADVAALAGKLPVSLGADVLDELSHILNLMRVTVDVAHAPSFHFDGYQAASQRVEKSVAALIEDLPKLIKFHRELDDARAAASAEVFEKILSQARGYFEERLIAWGGRAPSRRHQPWHDDAICLWTVLNRTAARDGKDLSFTHPGAPAVAFIVNALNRVKVRHSGAEAVAQTLARHQRRLEREWKTAFGKRSAIATV
jgi:hypothetical protein